jgi:Prephenate dehydrogenase
VRFPKITIVGVGLLGGSIGLAVKRRRLADEVAGYVRREAGIAECEKAGATDYATTDLLTAVSNADLVILCTPLAQMRSLTKQLLPALKRGAIVTDVGSVKNSVVRDIAGLVQKAGAHFIGSHPMAGSEKTGVAAARADLFQNAACVVTPTKNSSPTALKKVEAFWKALGSRVLRMDANLHDELVSRSSHLPHLTAAVLTNLVLNPKLPKEQAKLCATGFRDTTRVASGSPEMWRDIAMANRKNLGRTLKRFIRDLQQIQNALEQADVTALEKFFQQAKQRRDHWCAACASPSPE